MVWDIGSLGSAKGRQINSPPVVVLRKELYESHDSFSHPKMMPGISLNNCAATRPPIIKANTVAVSC
jgi:hypothetical protein